VNNLAEGVSSCDKVSALFSFYLVCMYLHITMAAMLCMAAISIRIVGVAVVLDD
jgi:hypothetical protein